MHVQAPISIQVRAFLCMEYKNGHGYDSIKEGDQIIIFSFFGFNKESTPCTYYIYQPHSCDI